MHILIRTHYYSSDCQVSTLFLSSLALAAAYSYQQFSTK